MSIRYKHLALTKQDIDFFIKRPKLANYFEECVRSTNPISRKDFLELSIYDLLTAARKLEEKEIKYLGRDMERPTIADAIQEYLVVLLKSEDMTVQKFIERSCCPEDLLKEAIGIINMGA